MSSSQPPSSPAHHDAISRLLNRPVNSATVAQSTKESAQPRNLRREQLNNLLVVRCAAEWFAIPAECVVHVSRVSKVHMVPHRSALGFRGVTPLSGAVIPVVDLTALLGLTQPNQALPRNARMVTVGTAQAPWAFEADEVPGVYALPQSAIKPLPMVVEAAPRRVSSGLVHTPHGMASVIDPQRLFAMFARVLE
ncbi:MAG: chemotaxis protein CheW [Phycisphaerales bacterium]|nr:chemotaxis protein CheW [Phycisphaerales bacterium]